MEDLKRFAEYLPSCASVLSNAEQRYCKVLQCLEYGLMLNATRMYRSRLHHTESSTIENYSSRLEEMTERVLNLERDNSRVRDEISKMRSERSFTTKEQALTFELKREQALQLVYSRRHALKLSTESRTNRLQLERELQIVKDFFKEAELNTEARYVPLASNSGFMKKLLIAQAEKDAYVLDNCQLEKHWKVLRKCQEVVHSMKTGSCEMEAIFHIISIVDSLYDDKCDTTNGYTNTDSEDPVNEHETEAILSSHEKFNFLFESSMLEAAALQATSSPKGVLRTVETLERFRNVPTISTPVHPLFTYCETLLQSSPAYNPISTEEAVECIKCASEQGQLKTLANWISQEWLPVSLDVANVILQDCICCRRCTCGRKNMAHKIFLQYGALKEASLCLIHQGRYSLFFHFTNSHEFSSQDYQMLLSSYPSVDLGRCLIMPPPPYQPPLAAVEVILLLLSVQCADIAVTLVQECTRLSAPLSLIDDMSANKQQWKYLISYLDSVGEDAITLDIIIAMTVSSAITAAVQSLLHETAAISSLDHQQCLEEQTCQTSNQSLHSSSLTDSSCVSSSSVEDSYSVSDAEPVSDA